MAVLVTGGAGYIGSHVVAELMRRRAQVVVLDNLSTGSQSNLPEGTRLHWGDVGDPIVLEEIFSRGDITAVLHFAASIKVEEAARKPLEYYANNTANTLALLKAMQKYNVNQLVFSSTAAVYGEPELVPVREDSPLRPLNAYGSSKAAVEWILRDASAAYGLGYVALRYFNVAGVEPGLERGYVIEDNPSHLIKAALRRVFVPGEPLPIFGTDYPTHDGTCIRDYIHVSDLATAHVEALTYLSGGGASAAFNVGYGHGYSVLEVVDHVRKVCGVNIPTHISDRRPGDAATVIADSAKIKAAFGWKPRHDDLDLMISSQWEWEKKVRPHL